MPTTPTALHVTEARLHDAYGPVTLRGMSLFWSQWGEQFYNRETLAWLKDDWKIDLIRAPLGVDADHDGYLADPKREMRKISAMVEAAIALDLYVIVDWHTHHPHVDAARAFFVEMARRYQGAANVIFELWNEPGPDYAWDRDIRPYHQAVLQDLRSVMPDALVILGTELYSQRVDRALAAPVDDANACYALHFYAASHGRDLRGVAEEAAERGLALFASEWGLSESTGDGALDLKEAENWWRFLEARGVSDAGWSLFDKLETSAALWPGASPCGHWPIEALTPSGLAMRRRLRAYASRRDLKFRVV